MHVRRRLRGGRGRAVGEVMLKSLWEQYRKKRKSVKWMIKKEKKMVSKEKKDQRKWTLRNIREQRGIIREQGGINSVKGRFEEGGGGGERKEGIQ